MRRINNAPFGQNKSKSSSAHANTFSSMIAKDRAKNSAARAQNQIAQSSNGNNTSFRSRIQNFASRRKNRIPNLAARQSRNFQNNGGVTNQYRESSNKFWSRQGSFWQKEAQKNYAPEKQEQVGEIYRDIAKTENSFAKDEIGLEQAAQATIELNRDLGELTHGEKFEGMDQDYTPISNEYFADLKNSFYDSSLLGLEQLEQEWTDVIDDSGTAQEQLNQINEYQSRIGDAQEFWNERSDFWDQVTEDFKEGSDIKTFEGLSFLASGAENHVDQSIVDDGASGQDLARAKGELAVTDAMISLFNKGSNIVDHPGFKASERTINANQQARNIVSANSEGNSLQEFWQEQGDFWQSEQVRSYDPSQRENVKNIYDKISQIEDSSDGRPNASQKVDLERNKLILDVLAGDKPESAISEFNDQHNPRTSDRTRYDRDSESNGAGEGTGSSNFANFLELSSEYSEKIYKEDGSVDFGAFLEFSSKLDDTQNQDTVSQNSTQAAAASTNSAEAEQEESSTLFSDFLKLSAEFDDRTTKEDGSVDFAGFLEFSKDFGEMKEKHSNSIGQA